MPNRLDLPPELLSLIEKRELEERRLQDCRREAEAAGETDRLPAEQEERRTLADRRSTEEDRRANDS